GGLALGWLALGWLALGWLAGAALQLHERVLLPPAWYLALLGMGLVGIVVGLRWRRGLVLALVGVAAASFGATGWRAADRVSQELSASLEGEELEVSGVVAGLPQRSPSGVRFRFEVESATRHGEPVTVPPLIAVGWYGGFHEEAVL